MSTEGETSRGPRPKRTDVTVRPLEERDLTAAAQIMGVAFATFLGQPLPSTPTDEPGLIHGRWRADPSAAFAAEVEGEVIGSNLATRWGSFAFFGPLTVRPDLWDQGIAQRLLDPTMSLFDAWEVRHAGLFTFPQSPRHVHLYQKYGFWPRYLTPIMSKSVENQPPTPGASRFSALSASERASCLNECHDVTNGSFDGLDVGLEIRSVAAQGLGDTVLLRHGSRLVGFAVCHVGPASEADPDSCFVKFGAVRPGPAAETDFDGLLDACEAFTVEQNARHLIAGVNLGRHPAYRRLLARGFRTIFQGVAMERDNQPGFNRPDVFILDDWR